MTNSNADVRPPNSDGLPPGNQTPTLAVVPEWDSSEVEDAIFLASRYGLTPDPWQATVLEGLLARRGDKWAAARCGLTVPRQNGKNAVIEIVELFKMVVMGRKILHTAHEVKTCRKAFLRLAGFFTNTKQYPELASLVAEVRKTNGQEAIVLTNGGSCEFIARSKSSGRGFTVDDIVADEAQELTDEEWEALQYTKAAAPSGDPQVLLTGTPPPTQDGRGDVFRRERDLAHAGGDGRLAWFEWSNDANARMDDPQVVADANPALGIRLSWDVVEDERMQSSPVGFARERGGVWDGVSGSSVIDADVWAGMMDADSKPGSHVALAVDVPPDGRRASISRAGERSDGLFHIETDTRNGTTWAVDRLVYLVKKRGAVVALDGGSRAAALIPDLVARGVEPVVYGTRDVVTACSGFLDKVDEGLLRHLGQVELNVAVDAARRRKVGDAWAWHRRDTSADISPLVAATLAVHALKEPQPKRKTGRSMAV